MLINWAYRACRFRLTAHVAVAVAVLFTASCAEPRYGIADSDVDGSPPDDHEAATTRAPADAAVSTIVQDPLACDGGHCQQANFATGQYAILLRSFGGSAAAGSGWFGEQNIVLADVRRDHGDDALRMEWQVCDFRGVTAVPLIPTLLFPLINYAVVSPQSLPGRSFTLKIVGNEFETVGDPLAIGYEELSAASCPAGTTQLHPDRPWLPQGRCKCPDTNDPPMSVEDCRVIDSDGDNQPAVTVRLWGGMEDARYTRILDSSQIKGQIAKDGRHTGTFVASLDTYHLQCAHELCARAPLGLCPSSVNPALFLPLEAKATGNAWTCAEVVAKIDATAQLGLGPITKPGC